MDTRELVDFQRRNDMQTPHTIVSVDGDQMVIFHILQSINLQEDWKLVSIWIGGNDLCAVCDGNVSAYVCACEEVGGGGTQTIRSKHLFLFSPCSQSTRLRTMQLLLKVHWTF